MKKLLKPVAVIIILVVVAICLTACGNYDMIDTVYSYDRAILKLPNGEVVEGKVQQWKDYDGESLQVKIGGKTYLTSTFNCVLMVE